jgi:hypothetical protein
MARKPDLLERARIARRPSRHVDFRSRFDVASDDDWRDLVRDIAAFANSGGGVIVFGPPDDTRPLAFDPGPFLAHDLADIAGRIARYTGSDFADLEIVPIERDGGTSAALIIGASEVPIPFIDSGGKNTGAENPKGAVYFRHGARSAAATHQDLLRWRDREVARHRKEWLRGIRQVVEAPPGHTVTVVPAAGPAEIGPVVRGPISATGRGTKVVVQNADEVWPFRQQELLREINKRLPSLKLSSYDVQCANWKLGTLRSHPEFAFRSHPKASPQYSQAYVDWFVEQGRRDLAFFQKLREERHLARLSAKQA